MWFLGLIHFFDSTFCAHVYVFFVFYGIYILAFVAQVIMIGRQWYASPAPCIILEKPTPIPHDIPCRNLHKPSGICASCWDRAHK